MKIYKTQENLKTMTEKKCSICKKPYEGFGNNAEPVNKGRCCDACNGIIVIPARKKFLCFIAAKWIK